MHDDIFKTRAAIIGGVDYLAMSGNFPREDLVITDRVWADGYSTYGQQLPEQYHNVACHEVMGIPEISRYSLGYGLFDNNLYPHSRSKSNSAFRNYIKESTEGAQSCLAPAVKQKSVKRCFDFLRMTYQNSRDKSRWETNGGLIEESYAVAHKIAERKRRNKLSQHFLALRSLLPHNPKKVDKSSTLSNAIMELNRQKHRIEELEQLNQSLTNAVRENSMSEACSSLSYGCAVDSRRDALKHCICEEVVVLVEKTSIPDESIIEVTMKKIASNCTHMDTIVTVDKCLRDMKLEVLRIEWRELDSTSQVIEGTIRKKTKGERWETKEIKAAVKHALTGS
ncbi:hypothetical protein SUGI_0062150 [Cryptomeria japonica]|nr:hypothetical protein SUGI_0062150 [Cryptomeria japonica]